MELITLTTLGGKKWKVNPLNLVDVWPNDTGSTVFLSGQPDEQATQESPETIADLFREATQIEHQNPYR